MIKNMIGDVPITRIEEMCGPFYPPNVLLPELPGDALEKHASWLEPGFYDAAAGCFVISMHSWVIRTTHHTIIVETCVGNDKERTFRDWNGMSGTFLEDLSKVAPIDSIDKVLCTHLHVDHVGWNTRWANGEWVATFPNARYLFGRVEWDHWQDQPEEAGPVIADSVRPIVEGGLADLVETDHRLTDEVTLEPTPGHTPGHVSVRIHSRSESALITGDMIHHPCQFVHPEWSASVDFDPDESRATRQSFVRESADQPVLIIGSHFAGPTAGRVVRDGTAWRLDY